MIEPNLEPRVEVGYYGQIAGHCDQLAKFYEDAAQEAEAISSGLHK